ISTRLCLHQHLHSFPTRRSSDLKNEQQQATKALEQQNAQQKAQEHQQKAGEKLKELGQSMDKQMQTGSQESLEEDAKMLRQILRSEEHTSELQSRENLVCRLLLE